MLFQKVTDHVYLTGKAGGHSGEGRCPGKQVSRWLVPSVPSRDLIAPSPWHGALVNSTQQPSQCSPVPLQGSVMPAPPPPKAAGKPGPTRQGAEVAAPAPFPAHHLAEDIPRPAPGQHWGPGTASVGSFPTTGLP